MAADDPVATLSDVSLGFGDAPDVLRGVDLEIRRDEFLTVIGPSGCGKSTVLNAIAGLMRPRVGHVMFAGREISGVNTNVGYMTQSDTLLPWRTVEDNVALPLRMRSTDRAETAERVEATLRMLDLIDARRKYPSQLSGGMKRRALLGRSMIYDPQLLLMDEPFAALDAQLRGQMHAELRSTVQRQRQSVLFVTHDIDEAVLLSDRLIVLGRSPARPIAELVIPFGADRDLDSLRFEAEFVKLTHSVHELLHEARACNPAPSTKGQS